MTEKKWIKISLNEEEKMEIENAEKQVKSIKLLRRLQAVKLKDSGWKHEQICSFFGINKNTITNWLKAYKKGGVDELLKWDYKGRISILSKEDQEKIRVRNNKKPFDTAKEAKAYIKEQFGIDWHLHWVQKLLKKSFNCHTSK